MRKKTHRSENPPLIVESVGRAALLASLLTVLGVQGLAFERFEAVKLGLLGLFALVIVAANVAQLIQERRVPSLRTIAANPMHIAVAAFVISALLSTIFSLSFNRSLWGDPLRSQGILAYLVFGVLYWQASQLDATFRRRLVALLTLITIPLALYAIVSFYRLDPFIETQFGRPGASTGHPAYLASWMVMALLFAGPQIAHDLRTRADRRLLPLYIVALILALWTLIITASRGALLGLGAGAMVGVFTWLALQRKRRLLLIAGAALIVAGLGYVLLSRAVDVPQGAQGISRLLAPYDRFRIAIWKGGALLTVRQTDPLTGAGTVRDTWTFLRPALGYGLETIPLTYSRFIEIRPIAPFLTDDQLVIDRFHNIIFDTVVMRGWLGVLTVFAVVQTALMAALRGLKLMRHGDWWKWLAIQLIAAVPSVLIMLWLIPPELWQRPAWGWAALAPIGVALGTIIGALVWMAAKGFTSDEPVELTGRQVALLATLMVICAQWVDNQFGFIQLATQPLWWIVLGMLAAGYGAAEGDQDDIPESADIWWSHALAVGLFLLFSFGGWMRSLLVTQRSASGWLLVVLLAAIFATAAFVAIRREGVIRVQPVLIALGAWAGYFIVSRLLIGSASAELDAAWQSGLLHPGVLIQAFQRIALPGAILAVAALLALTGLRVWGRTRWSVSVWIAVALLVGGWFFVRGSAASMLHRLGAEVAAINQPEIIALSDTAFAAGDSLKLRIDPTLAMQWMIVQHARGTEIADQLDDLLTVDPFIVNAREWLLFEAQTGVKLP